MRQSTRLRSARSELDEKAMRGDVKGIVANINSIIASGKDKAKPALLGFISDLLSSAAKCDGDTGKGSKGKSSGTQAERQVEVQEMVFHQGAQKSMVIQSNWRDPS